MESFGKWLQNLDRTNFRIASEYCVATVIKAVPEMKRRIEAFTMWEQSIDSGITVRAVELSELEREK